MEGLYGIVFALGLTLLLAFMGYRERKTHREEIEYFKANGWEEAYRFPRHYWWHRETNKAIPFGGYFKDRKGVQRIVEGTGRSGRKRKR